MMFALSNRGLKLGKPLFKRSRFEALLQGHQNLRQFVAVAGGDLAALGSSVKSPQFDADIL